MTYQSYRPPKRPGQNNAALGCAFAAAIGIALLVVFAVVGQLTKTKTTTAPPSVAASSAIPAKAKAKVAAPKAKVAAPVAAKKPVVVLTEHGNGIKSTKTFTVTGDWDLQYSFDCSNFGSSGNFAVSDSSGMPLVNELAAKGSDTTHEHDGPGQMSLSVDSECTWAIRVLQLP